VLELRGPNGRGVIVDEHSNPEGELAMLAGRLRRIVDGACDSSIGPYIARHEAASLTRYREHLPHCTRSLKPKTDHERTTVPVRLVGRPRR
jgi:hypothetical protein